MECSGMVYFLLYWDEIALVSAGGWGWEGEGGGKGKGRGLA